MKRQVARFIHEATNASTWAENQQWDAGNKLLNFGSRVIRALPFSLYELEQKAFFRERPMAVSGESIVVQHDPQTVYKYMLRYPRGMPLKEFEGKVREETELMQKVLGRLAIQTDVRITPANIFRWPIRSVDAVTQVQPLLDLELNPPFSLTMLDTQEPTAREQTLSDMHELVAASRTLYEEYGCYPDIPPSSHNVRVNQQTGRLMLIDVMPVHADGRRLIGDKPKNQVRHIEAALGEFENR